MGELHRARSSQGREDRQMGDRECGWRVQKAEGSDGNESEEKREEKAQPVGRRPKGKQKRGGTGGEMALVRATEAFYNLARRQNHRRVP